jgi:hypothetical protein
MRCLLTSSGAESMPHTIASPETDLLVPLPAAGEQWDPQTIHTHYFGFTIADAAIGGFLYIRYQPAFPLAQGGVCIYRGLDNVHPTDMEHCDYRITMPWPRFADSGIETANGLRIEFTDPGRQARITYVSRDERVHVDVTATAVTPLLARGYAAPGEELHHTDTRQAGGSEQFMHMRGELRLGDAHHRIDCHHFAWVVVSGEHREVVEVARNVHAYHPTLYTALSQTITARDEAGDRYTFSGRAIAAANIPQWPNASFRDAVYRWEDGDGRVVYSGYQEFWNDRYQRAVGRFLTGERR